MRQLRATLRHRPGPLVGTFVALFLAALVVTVSATMIRVGQTLTVPAQRLAATAAVVTGHQDVRVTTGTGHSAATTSTAMNAYRRLPVALAGTLAAVPGVAAAVPDRSVPAALVLADGRTVTGPAADPVTGQGWQSAVLAPFTLRRGHQPVGPDQMVVGAGLARSAGIGVGSTVRLAGQDRAPFRVVGLAGTAAGNPAQDWTVFFSDAEAAALYGHPGQADLIGVLADPGTSPAALDAALRRVAGAHHVSVAVGSARGQVENLAAADDGTNLGQLASGAGVDLALIALFVVAGAVALSVAQRSRTLALLRAVGATPGQVRRLVALELAVIGAAAGLLAYLPGVGLSALALGGMAAHQLVPPGIGAPVNPWILLIAVGSGVGVAEIAGSVAARRAGRTPPAAAVAGARTDRRWPGPIRVVLGLAALGGGVALGIEALGRATSPTDQLNMALLMLLSLLAAVALLGPLLVLAAELVLRLPVRTISRVAGRLATAEVRGRPRRMASAVVAVALAVAFVGAIYVVDATQTHAATVQGPQRLAASQVVTAPGPGLATAALRAVRAVPGVATAVGMTPTTVYLPGGTDPVVEAEAVTDGVLPSVLHLGLTAGSLAHFGPGDIAVSRLEAGQGALGAHVGQVVTAHLADGTPYRATVSAIYTRSLGFADAIVPWSAAGGGHMGSNALGQILVSSRPGATAPGAGATTTVAAGLSAVAARFPGLSVAPRTVVNAQYEQLTSQGSYLNNLILGLVLVLAAVTLVNTLVVTTLDHRDALFLLWRVGTTKGQLLASVAWQSLLVGGVGVVLGLATGAAAVVAVARALTGNWHPYVPWPAVAAVAAGVLLLAGVATLGPTMGLLRKVGAPT